MGRAQVEDGIDFSLSGDLHTVNKNILLQSKSINVISR